MCLVVLAGCKLCLPEATCRFPEANLLAGSRFCLPGELFLLAGSSMAPPGSEIMLAGSKVLRPEGKTLPRGSNVLKRRLSKKFMSKLLKVGDVCHNCEYCQMSKVFA